MPGRNPVPPPQLPRNAPVMDVVHPVQVNLLVVFRNDRDLTVLHHFRCVLCQRLDFAEPLRRKPRLDHRPAAVAFSQRNRVIFFPDQEPLRAQILQHALARFETIQPRISARILIHTGVLVHHIDLRQVMPQPGLKIIGIVRRRDLHRARPELRLREVIGNDRNLAVHQRQQNFFPMQMPVALVFFVYCDSRITQHRFRASGCDRDELIRPNHRVTNLIQLSSNLFMLHFQIRNRRLAARTPVDDILPAIDQPFFIQPNKNFAHRARKILVHGEILAVPIYGHSQPLHLVKDGATVMPLPFPNALHKLFPAQVAPLFALARKLTQMMVERQLASEGKERRDLGREKFVERVWEWKRHYGGAILDQMKRLGVSVDWDREYFTMDENLSRAVREVFVRLYEEGLIYRGKYIVNWCPRCETAISDLEVKHEEVAGKLYEIRYPVIGTNEFITVATTRPETMLGDTAVAVNEKDERYRHLHGKKVLLPLMNREIPIITDELAQPEFGTGAVKVTPAHDPNDFQAGLRHNLPQIDVMDQNARMNQNAGAYAGLDRFEARKRVLEDLRTQGFLVGEKDYTISLGNCDRCGTVIEPRLSTQWFIKIKPLAERATEVVENGEITIVPENYKQIYLNWMNNIHDWCISRQLWWGHRIPAWHCSCGEIIVAREAPQKCTKCAGSKLTQDRDVLDTWFSSGLLPFTTLGWPQKTRDEEVFYPTTLLITAYEILFFWVARMIMFGCHFMNRHKQDPALKQASGWCEKKDDSVPFRQVYIHALVRDAERQKMSKTKGNVIDPLEIIQRFGTDATRFTLAAMAAPGTDIAFSESRTEGYRNFANKIWNAARFMFMNVDRVEPGLRPVAGSETRPPMVTLEDRWIFSRFNRVTREVNEALQTYRFHEAANRIYDFFWGEFCDWYIELIKPRLMETASPETATLACANLSGLFEAALRLLHPVMPFITEEIWQAMYDRSEERRVGKECRSRWSPYH